MMAQQNDKGYIWRWGNIANAVHLNNFPKLKIFLENKFGGKLNPDFKIPDLNISSSKFSEIELKNIFPNLKENQISLKDDDRLRYTLGRSYYDIIKAFSNQNFFPPDFILFPETIEDISHILKQANLLNHKVNLFVPHEDVALQKSFANIPTVRMYYFDEPNIYDLASAQYWVFFEKDFDAFKTMVTQWS